MVGLIIRPSELPDRASPVASEKIPTDNGTDVGGTTIEKLVLAGRPTASRAEAEAGVQATKAMTPLTTKQAIDALAVTAITAGANTSVDLSDPNNPVISYDGSAVTDGDKGGAVVSGSGAVWVTKHAVADRAALKALDTTVNTAAFLKEAGREGQFIWSTGDYSALIAADTAEGIYLKADAVAATSGAWVRDGGWLVTGLDPRWFGAVADRIDRTDGIAVSGDATFTSAGASFSASDIGKSIYVIGAGAASAGLVTTIASINSGTSVELTVAPSTSVNPAYFTYGTDSQPAITAAVAMGSYGANSSKSICVKLAGGGYLTKATIDLSAAHGLNFMGAGREASSLRAAGNFPIITMVGSSSNGINKITVSDMTLWGGGRAYSNAYAIYASWTNHSALRNLLVKGSRAAVYSAHNWQFEWNNLVATGGSDSDKNYDGYYLDASDLSYIDNAIIGDNVYAQYVERDGFRIINGQGSKFNNCEAGGCGRHAYYIGDPPSGTVKCQWLHFTNCLGDSTGGTVWNIVRGSATELSEMQFSNCWGGNATGRLMFIKNAANIIFSNHQLVRSTTAGLVIEDSAGIAFGGQVLITNTSGSGSGWGVLLQNCSGCRITDSKMNKNAGSNVSIAEGGTSNNNMIIGNEVDSGMSIIGATTIVMGNVGYATHSSGVADVLSGNTTATVNHNLSRTPSNGDIIINPRFNPGSHYWVDNLTSTTFQINMASAPGSNIGFNWQADVARG